MAATEFHMDGALARAARHLCRVSAKTIARHADISPEALREYEKGGDALTDEQVQAVVRALTRYGAVFITEDEFGGLGVRRKFNRTNVQMIETWEGEGGPVAHDDV